MDAVLFVDNAVDAVNELARMLGDEVERVTGNSIRADYLFNVILEDVGTITKIQNRIDALERQQLKVVGLLFDVCEPGAKEGGKTLLKHVKSTPNLRDVPVVMYTGKYISPKECDYTRLGAAGVIVRPVIGGPPYTEMAEQALRYLGLEHLL
jgi:CheY-like chemotaxis protein